MALSPPSSPLPPKFSFGQAHLESFESDCIRKLFPVLEVFSGRRWVDHLALVHILKVVLRGCCSQEMLDNDNQVNSEDTEILKGILQREIQICDQKMGKTSECGKILESHHIAYLLIRHIMELTVIRQDCEWRLWNVDIREGNVMLSFVSGCTIWETTCSWTILPLYLGELGALNRFCKLLGATVEDGGRTEVEHGELHSLMVDQFRIVE